MKHSLTKLCSLIVMGSFTMSLGFVLPAYAGLTTTLAPTTEEPQFDQARMAIRGKRGHVKMVMNGVPDAVGSPCAVVFTLSVNSGEDFELRLECEVVDVIDRHPRRLERTPNFAVLRTTIADKIEPPLEDGDLVRFGGADVFINDEFRATVGGIYQERLDRDRIELPTDSIDVQPGDAPIDSEE